MNNWYIFLQLLFVIVGIITGLAATIVLLDVFLTHEMSWLQRFIGIVLPMIAVMMCRLLNDMIKEEIL